MKTRKLVTPAKFCNSCPKTKGEANSVLTFLCLKNQRRGIFCSYVLMSKKHAQPQPTESSESGESCESSESSESTDSCDSMCSDNLSPKGNNL